MQLAHGGPRLKINRGQKTSLRKEINMFRKKGKIKETDSKEVIQNKFLSFLKKK